LSWGQESLTPRIAKNSVTLLGRKVFIIAKKSAVPERFEISIDDETSKLRRVCWVEEV